MKILNAKQIKEVDVVTITNHNISGLQLMEQAAVAIASYMLANFELSFSTVHVFCGIGNNGGDGLAVARLLLNQHIKVKVYIVNFSDKRSPDFLQNYDRLKELGCWPEVLNKGDILPEISEKDYILDAVFGQGLNRQPEQWVKNVLQNINNAKARVIAIDFPSGLFMDVAPSLADVIIEADYTLSFEVPKLPFFLPQSGEYFGEWLLLPIGLDKLYLEKVTTNMFYITSDDALQLYKPRKKFAYKNILGHVLVIGGSYGKIGAAMLSSEAALNSGAGLVTALIPRCGYQIFQTALPEIMVETCRHDEYISEINYKVKPSAIVFGIGADTKDMTKRAFTELLEKYKGPLIIDADGLNMLAANKDLLYKLPSYCVLTPHPGELRRLIGEWEDDFEKIAKVKAFSKTYNVVVVIKGAYSITVNNDTIYVNSTGNPGMATAGSGDVLAGIIGGLAAQGYTSTHAAIFGVYLHGLAGDLSAAQNGFESLTATEIIDFIGDAYLELQK